MHSDWLSPLLLCNRFRAHSPRNFFSSSFFVYFWKLVSISLFIWMHKITEREFQKQSQKKRFYAKYCMRCITVNFFVSYFGGQMKWCSIFLYHFVLTSITGSCHNSPFLVLFRMHCSQKQAQNWTVRTCRVNCFAFGRKSANIHIFHFGKHISIVQFFLCQIGRSVLYLELLFSLFGFLLLRRNLARIFREKNTNKLNLKRSFFSFSKQMHLFETMGLLIFIFFSFWIFKIFTDKKSPPQRQHLLVHFVHV